MCNCFTVWHRKGEVRGCVFYVRRHLTPEIRDVLRMLHTGLPYREAANALRIPHSTCWSRIKKAQHMLCTRGIRPTVRAAVQMGVLHINPGADV